MLAAMERALADGSDILNMWIGSAFQTWPQYPTAVGADLLVANGMIVITSMATAARTARTRPAHPASATRIWRCVVRQERSARSHS